MNTHQQTMERAKADFTQAKDALSRALAATPDERLNWSPSATARTPLHQAAHAAKAIRQICELLEGRPFPSNSTAEFDASLRAWEEQFTAREPVLALLESNSAAYLQWLDALTPEALEGSIELPFGSGNACMAQARSFAPHHTNWHTAQINYIQTIYGDQVWN